MNKLLELEPSETVVWRACIDKEKHIFKVVKQRCVCGPRSPGLDGEFCPACRTNWLDEGWHLPDVRLVFKLHDPAAPESAIYIGRKKDKRHFGNPFSHLAQSKAAVQVATLAEAIASFEAWLKGTAYNHIEPERREWILDNLESLRDRALICHCAPPGGVNLAFRDCCHGQVYLRLLEAPRATIAPQRQLVAKQIEPTPTLAVKAMPKESKPKPEPAKPVKPAKPAPVLETQIALFPELEPLKQPKGNYELQAGAWHLPGLLDRDEQQDLLEWLGFHGRDRLEALKTPSGLDFSVKVASIGRKWLPYKYLDIEDEPFQFKLEVIARNALNAIEAGIYPHFRPDTAILNYYSPTAKLSLHQDDSEDAALIEAGSPIITIALGMSCRARQGNCDNKSQPYRDFIFASGDGWVMGGESRKAFHGVMKIMPETKPSWLDINPAGRFSLSIRQTRKTN